MSQENALSFFVGGLKKELNMAVKIINPLTLSQAYKSATMQEAYLEAVDSVFRIQINQECIVIRIFKVNLPYYPLQVAIKIQKQQEGPIEGP